MLLNFVLRRRRSTVEVTGLREGGDVRGCSLAAIMILELWLQDAYISTICRIPLHVR
jgi:hypothetical protein